MTGAIAGLSRPQAEIGRIFLRQLPTISRSENPWGFLAARLEYGTGQ
jgi:hypothetical protein